MSYKTWWEKIGSHSLNRAIYQYCYDRGIDEGRKQERRVVKRKVLKARLEQAKKSCEEYNEHFYWDRVEEKEVQALSSKLEPKSFDPWGLKECLNTSVVDLKRQLTELEGKK